MSKRSIPFSEQTELVLPHTPQNVFKTKYLCSSARKKKLSAEISLNETIDVDKDGNPLTYIDVISSDESITGEIERKISSQKALRFVDTLLDERERQIIKMRYGLSDKEPMTQREVALLLGISRSYVSRIEKTALEKLLEGFKS